MQFNHPAKACRLTNSHGVFATRAILAVLIAFSLIWAVTTFATILIVNGLSWLDIASILVFTILALWLAQSFWSHMAGFCRAIVRLWRPDQPASCAMAGPRIALVMPIFNEDVEAVFSRVAALWEGLERHQQAHRFDIFILSDSNDPFTWLREIEAWRQLRSTLPNSGRIYYRRRLQNTKRKTGNLEDFVERWGGGYGYLVPLDADSLMATSTIHELVRRMDENPKIGLIQVPPKLINGRTLYARALQHAGELVGAINASGVAAWSGPDGNYWGHNAIIRMTAFSELCGLPTLPGRPPFGGDIMSHDFVEAALLRRGGLEIRIADDLRGSFEEPPPGVDDYLARDRRWCQGNLQHASILTARRFRLVSRMHLFIGIMGYLTAPIWLIFLILSAAQGFELAYGTPLYFREDLPFPVLPTSVADEANRLLIFTLGWLFKPKILGAVLAAIDPARRKLLGGPIAIALSLIIEVVVSVLLAPIMMLQQSWFVLSILLGGVIEWRPQRRQSGRSTLMGLQRNFLMIQLIGLGAGVAIWFLAPPLFWWLLPVVAGPALAPYVIAVINSEAIGSWLRQRKLLLTVEEVAPSAVIERYKTWLGSLELPPAEKLVASVIADPRALNLHIELLLGRSLKCPPNVARIAGHVGPETLSNHDLLHLLADPEALRSAQQTAWIYWPEEELAEAVAARGVPGAQHGQPATAA